MAMPIIVNKILFKIVPKISRPMLVAPPMVPMIRQAMSETMVMAVTFAATYSQARMGDTAIAPGSR